MRALGAAFVVVLLVSLSGVDAANGPGFKVTLSQNGVNYAKDIGVAYLLKKLSVVTVPNQGGEAHAPVVGAIDWQLTDIVLSGLAIPTSSIVFNPGRGLTVSIGGAAIHCSMNFHYRKKHWPHISGHGTIDIGMSQTAIAIAIAMGEANGRPTLTVLETGVGIGDLDVKVHGHDSWIYNFFIDILKGLIKKEAEKAIAGAITDELNKGANNALQTVPIEEKLGNLAEVDFALIAPPNFQAADFTIDSKGEFYYIPSPTEAPFAPAPLPDTVTAEMFQAFFSSYVPNTASYVFFKAGVMQGSLHDKDLPSWAPIRLNTTSWRNIVPKLYQLYPNMLMQADIAATQSPTLNFAKTGLTALGIGHIVVSVIQPSGTLVPVFTLGVNLTTTAKAFITGGDRIAGSLAYLGSTLTLESSQIGNFDFTQLNDIIKDLATDGVVPFLNYFLQQGVNIPTIKGVHFTNPTIGYGNGFIYMSTDVSYTPPAEDTDGEGGRPSMDFGTAAVQTHAFAV